MKNKLKVVSSILGFLVTMPIWFYLLYQILVRVQATELMMFLFWIYLPVALVVGIITKVVEHMTE